MKRLLLALALVLLWPLGANAANNDTTLTGAHLLDVCTRPDMSWIDFCNGFMQAAHDVGAIAGEVCVPKGITRTDLVKLFEREATTLLQAGGLSSKARGINLARAILSAGFPCR